MAITNGYATLAELKARLDIDDTNDDTILESIIEAVSRFIESEPVLYRTGSTEVRNSGGTGRLFYGQSQTRYFTATHTRRIIVDDYTSISAIATDDDGDDSHETTWAASDYLLHPRNAASKNKPYTEIVVANNGDYYFPCNVTDGVKVTGVWGYIASTDTADAPKLIKEACLLQSERLWKRKDAILGVAGSAELGQLTVIPKLDPDVALMVNSFRRKVSL